MLASIGKTKRGEEGDLKRNWRRKGEPECCSPSCGFAPDMKNDVTTVLRILVIFSYLLLKKIFFIGREKCVFWQMFSSPFRRREWRISRLVLVPTQDGGGGLSLSSGSIFQANTNTSVSRPFSLCAPLRRRMGPLSSYAPPPSPTPMKRKWREMGFVIIVLHAHCAVPAMLNACGVLFRG